MVCSEQTVAKAQKENIFMTSKKKKCTFAYLLRAAKIIEKR